MIEQKIEKIIIDALSAALSAASVSGVQFLGAWQTAAEGSVKGIEDGSLRGYLSVKVSPRQHETFTVADASFDVTVSLNVRAEVDARGVSFLAITDALAAKLYSWQKSFSTFQAAFAVANEFSPSGFRLDGGDCGLDRPNAVWSWQQDFVIQGIILN